jgi:hypothetical protein
MSCPPASILGIGAVTPVGRDLSTIAERISGPIEPAEILRVSDDLLADPTSSRGLRRADRFVRMAAIAAIDSFANADFKGSMERVGLIVTSGFGPHGRGFKFLDGILDCGDAEALPTDFSHSVHGAAASYIAGLLDLRGPSLSTTDFLFGFEQAIVLAQCWLAERTCERVIVGAVEELGKVLIECAPRLLPAGKTFPLGEGAVFFALGPESAGGIAKIDASAQAAAAELVIVDEPMIFAKPLPQAKSARTFSPYFGHTASNSAFQALGGLLSFSNARLLGSPVSTRPSPLPSPGVPGEGVIDTALTFRTSCDSSASILITKTRRYQ